MLSGWSFDTTVNEHPSCVLNDFYLLSVVDFITRISNTFKFSFRPLLSDHLQPEITVDNSNISTQNDMRCMFCYYLVVGRRDEQPWLHCSIKSSFKVRKERAGLGVLKLNKSSHREMHFLLKLSALMWDKVTLTGLRWIFQHTVSFILDLHTCEAKLSLPFTCSHAVTIFFSSPSPSLSSTSIFRDKQMRLNYQGATEVIKLNR